MQDARIPTWSMEMTFLRKRREALRFRAAVTGSASRRTEGNLAKPDKRPSFISR